MRRSNFVSAAFFIVLVLLALFAFACGDDEQQADDNDDDGEQQSSYEKLCGKLLDCEESVENRADWMSDCTYYLENSELCVMRCFNENDDCDKLAMCREAGSQLLDEYCTTDEDGDLDMEMTEKEDGDMELTELDFGKEEEAEASTEFDPEKPGLTVTFMVSFLEAMGQPINIATGTVYPTVREDLAEDDIRDIPIDTCRLNSYFEDLGPECESDADCAPEQYCDINDGNICRTQIEALLDVGSITVSGFPGGEKEFLHNAGQSGAYTEGGQGDGQIEEVGFNTTYVLSGAGDVAQGLGAISGSLEVPAQFQVLTPEIAPDPQMQFSVANINPQNDFQITWQGGNDPNSVITLTIAGLNDSVECRMQDDGEFTIGKTYIQAIGLDPGDNFLNWINNAMEIKTEVTSPIEGEGVEFGEMYFLQTNAGVFLKVVAE